MRKKSHLLLIFLFLFSANGISTGQEPAAQSISPSSQDNKISLDIKGMDIVDALKILANRSGMNIVVGKNVTGKVTLFLKNVDLRDAFQIILLSNDLACETRGDIINVMTQRDYELRHGQPYLDSKQPRIIQLKYAKAANLLKSLNMAKTNVGKVIADENSNTLILLDTPEKLEEMEELIKNMDLPLETRVFSLNYAQADKLNAKIQREITKGVGIVRIDERTNKIAITDYPQKLDAIAEIVRAFDEKTPQVLIDAQIIEISPSDKFEMGVDWDYWLQKNLRLASSMPTAGAVNKLSIGTAAAGSSVEAKGEYKGIIDLLRTIGDTKILSSPRITVLNNQEAKILVGTKDAFITSTVSQSGSGTAVTSQSVNFVDVGIKLFVTPMINRDNFVTMRIKPEISSSETRKILSEGQETEIPIVTTSEAETSVTVKDGVTIIIGGLRKDERTKTVKKIPLVGDIPLVGHLFRNTSDEVTKTELVILLTPHIMSGETAFTEFSQVTPKDGATAKMVNGNILLEKFSSNLQDEALNAQYYRLVIDKIKDSAKLGSLMGKKGEVSLSFAVSKDGKLISEPEVLDATDSSLVPLAVKAVKGASPFPSFPFESQKKEERFKVTLSYE
ncbi:MAG: secretin N-terminal domain-containing protein [Deltaproteobacteria bacterium]